MTFVFAGFLSVASISVSRLRRPQSLGCVVLSLSVASVSVPRLRRSQSLGCVGRVKKR